MLSKNQEICFIICYNTILRMLEKLEDGNERERYKLYLEEIKNNSEEKYKKWYLPKQYFYKKMYEEMYPLMIDLNKIIYS